MIQGVSSKLRGCFDRKLDPKNRVAIPTEWRPCEGGALFLLYSEKDDTRCVKALTESKLEEIEQNVKNEPEMTTRDKNEFLEWLNASCEEVTVNSQGKLLIPKKMCEQADFGSELLLVGRGGFFEIWSTGAYDNMTEGRKPRIDKIRDTYGFI